MTPKTEAGKRLLDYAEFRLPTGETAITRSIAEQIIPEIEAEAMHVREVELRRSLGDEWGQRVLDAVAAYREALIVAVEGLEAISEMSDATEQSSFREEAWAALDAIPAPLRDNLIRQEATDE